MDTLIMNSLQIHCSLLAPCNERQLRTEKRQCHAQRKHENDDQLSMASTTHQRSNLAVEVIDMILRDVGPGHLQSLLTVNSFFYSNILRRLYHTIILHSPTKSINLCRTLLRNPSLPPLLRALHINFSTVSPTRNLYLLFHSVLLHLSVLASLTIELPRHHSPMWIFERCTFKLTSPPTCPFPRFSAWHHRSHATRVPE